MAYSPSPQLSPRAAGPGVTALKSERPMTPSAHAQPLSKRDKRRTALSEKLNEITAAFSNNRDSHYRQQLQTLQADMNLIMRADPYQGRPLDDFGDDVAELVGAAMAGTSYAAVNGAGVGHGGQRRPDPEASASSGRWYARYVEEVNNAMEERDAALTVLHNNYERALHKLHINTQYKIRFAEEEHRVLAGTLRERLIQSIGHKRSRLMREKEQLDIADSNALLLHPNQFSITNPASPGGAQSNRKTRNTRQRPGDLDDVGAGYAAGDGGGGGAGGGGGSGGGGGGGSRKKRKAAAEEGEVESPAPKHRMLDVGAASPHRDNRARLVAAQMEAPLYSVERLFTEKELSFSLNAAAQATAQYFANLRARAYGLGVREPAAPVATNGAEEDDGTGTGSGGGGSGGGGGGSGSAHDGEGGDEGTPAAVEMDRAANVTTSSSSHHATRSTRHLVSFLGDVTISQKRTSFGLAVPLILPASSLTKNGSAPPLSVLAPSESEEDLKKMERNARGPHGGTDPHLLEQVCLPLDSLVLQHPPTPIEDALFFPPPPPLPGPTTTTTLRGLSSVLTTGAAGAAGAAGAVPMSAQSSLAGASDVGGGGGAPPSSVPMSRRGAGSSMGLGTTTMKRTASNSGTGRKP